MEQTLRQYFKKLFLKIFNHLLKKDTMYLRIPTKNNQCQDNLVKLVDFLEKSKNLLGIEAKRTSDL